MKVQCIGNNGSYLTQNCRKIIGEHREADYHLTIGESYGVYGISIYKGFLNYLVINDANRPNFRYAMLFKVVDRRLPFEWYFREYTEIPNCPLLALWGYDKLVNDDDYYESLVEGDRIAISDFIKAKDAIDKEMAFYEKV